MNGCYYDSLKIKTGEYMEHYGVTTLATKKPALEVS